MRGAQTEIEKRGAKLRVIGNGSPTQAGFFAADHGLQGAVFTDPERATYRALGMKKGAAYTFNLAAAKHAARAVVKGFRQHRTQGHPYQQGGVLIVDAAGDIRFSHISNSAGDHPSTDTVLRALDALRAEE